MPKRFSEFRKKSEIRRKKEHFLTAILRLCNFARGYYFSENSIATVGLQRVIDTLQIDWEPTLLFWGIPVMARVFSGGLSKDQV